MNVNEAYEGWSTAEGQAKADALEVLFRAVKRFAGRLINSLKGEYSSELAHDAVRQM